VAVAAFWTVTKRSVLLSAEFMEHTLTQTLPFWPHFPQPTNPISLWKTCGELKVDLAQLQQWSEDKSQCSSVQLDPGSGFWILDACRLPLGALLHWQSA